MHTPGAENGRPGVGAAAKEVAEHASALARLELELAGLEMKRKAGALGAGVGLAVAAALVAVYGLGFVFATMAAALATFLPTWLALLIMSVALLAVAGILAAVAKSQLRRATPPVPEQAIAEAKRTSEAIRH
jgi:Putative Actinobacterial Holin-X, holin superfamily III